uniref:Uncharacterized protein n=1 Tax=Noctiluca scintillans TaxID=2966 RepID=A0A7S1FFC8_NOCSC|mmetsp:Transcript_56586/g.151214  ORF Transcript_56586/g.151214 Transcript_56586/m.151214 type:complete len:148 (+) Transcript_56586:131-574(+)
MDPQTEASSSPKIRSVAFSRCEFEDETCLLDECPCCLDKVHVDPLAIIDGLVRLSRREEGRREQEERVSARRSWSELVDEVKTSVGDLRAKREARSAQMIRERVALRRGLSLEECFLPSQQTPRKGERCATGRTRVKSPLPFKYRKF